jgi:hypothetical protein
MTGARYTGTGVGAGASQSGVGGGGVAPPSNVSGTGLPSGRLGGGRDRRELRYGLRDCWIRAE